MPKKLLKDKRINVLIPSETHQKLKYIAEGKGISINALIVDHLQYLTYTKENKAYIKAGEEHAKQLEKIRSKEQANPENEG